MGDERDWRAVLESQKQILLADLSLAADASAPVELDQSRVGRLSRMDAIQAQAMSRAADRRRQTELRQIEAALIRLRNGHFGECAACGDAIAPSRLAFSPANPFCLSCAENRQR